MSRNRIVLLLLLIALLMLFACAEGIVKIPTTPTSCTYVRLAPRCNTF